MTIYMSDFAYQPPKRLKLDQAKLMRVADKNLRQGADRLGTSVDTLTDIVTSAPNPADVLRNPKNPQAYRKYSRGLAAAGLADLVPEMQQGFKLQPSAYNRGMGEDLYGAIPNLTREAQYRQVKGGGKRSLPGGASSAPAPDAPKTRSTESPKPSSSNSQRKSQPEDVRKPTQPNSQRSGRTESSSSSSSSSKSSTNQESAKKNSKSWMLPAGAAGAAGVAGLAGAGYLANQDENTRASYARYMCDIITL